MNTRGCAVASRWAGIGIGAGGPARRVHARAGAGCVSRCQRQRYAFETCRPPARPGGSSARRGRGRRQSGTCLDGGHHERRVGKRRKPKQQHQRGVDAAQQSGQRCRSRRGYGGCCSSTQVVVEHVEEAEAAAVQHWHLGLKTSMPVIAARSGRRRIGERGRLCATDAGYPVWAQAGGPAGSTSSSLSSGWRVPAEGGNCTQSPSACTAKRRVGDPSVGLSDGRSPPCPHSCQTACLPPACSSSPTPRLWRDACQVHHTASARGECEGCAGRSGTSSTDWTVVAAVGLRSSA